MNIHVHFFTGDFQEEQDHRKNRGRQNITVSLRECVLDQAIANEAAVNEYENRVAVQLLDLGLRNEAVDAQFPGISQFFPSRAPPRWRLRQADALQWLYGCHRNQLI